MPSALALVLAIVVFLAACASGQDSFLHVSNFFECETALWVWTNITDGTEFLLVPFVGSTETILLPPHALNFSLLVDIPAGTGVGFSLVTPDGRFDYPSLPVAPNPQGDASCLGANGLTVTLGGATGTPSVASSTATPSSATGTTSLPSSTVQPPSSTSRSSSSSATSSSATQAGPSATQASPSGSQTNPSGSQPSPSGTQTSPGATQTSPSATQTNPQPTTTSHTTAIIAAVVPASVGLLAIVAVALWVLCSRRTRRPPPPISVPSPHVPSLPFATQPPPQFVNEPWKPHPVGVLSTAPYASSLGSGSSPTAVDSDARSTQSFGPSFGAFAPPPQPVPASEGAVSETAQLRNELAELRAHVRDIHEAVAGGGAAAAPPPQYQF